MQAGEEISKNLFQMKIILYGDGGKLLVEIVSRHCSHSVSSHTETEPLADQVAQLAQEVYNNDLLQLLVQNIWRFEFEVSQ